MNNNMYLIQGEDYIKHIDDKVLLYGMVRQLAHQISKLPSNRGSKGLAASAERCSNMADQMFRSGGIPGSYLVFGNEDDLTELMENELILPEDAGYFPCDGDCGCDDCDYCNTDDYEVDDSETDDDEDFADMMAFLSYAFQSIFGDDVTVHIIID